MRQALSPETASHVTHDALASTKTSTHRDRRYFFSSLLAMA
jgi:hypothetical protein